MSDTLLFNRNLKDNEEYIHQQDEIVKRVSDAPLEIARKDDFPEYDKEVTSI